MKKMFIGLALVATTATTGVTGCAYGGIAMNAAGDKVAVARNDGFLFGMLRKVFICQASAQGVSQCQSTEAP